MTDPEPRPDAEVVLNEAQQRHLAVSIRHVANMFDEAERLVVLSRSSSPFRRFSSDVPPWQAGVINDYLERVRRKVLAFAERARLDPGGRPLDLRHALNVHVSMASIAVTEMRPRYLRGYGQVDPNAAEIVERACDDIEQTLEALERFIAARAEAFDERISRLGEVEFDTELLRIMARVIDEHGLVEFRPAFNSLLARLEEQSFHIALFGRVSSGKSSLINALIGAPLLPVGVSPITAVPTRVRAGSPPELIVRIADGESQRVALDDLNDFASEEKNPGNVRRVSRLEVVCPSPILPTGVELVDTPGIGALATTGAAETFTYLPRADLAVLLIDVGSSIGGDELELVRMLYDVGVPLRIVISKADLVDAASRERMRRYVEESVLKELGLPTAVGVVSSVPAGQELLQTWLSSEMRPVLDKAGLLRRESVNRIAEALREHLVGRLRAHLRAQRVEPTTSESPERDAIRKRVGHLREAYYGIPERIRASWLEVLRGSASEVAAEWKAHRRPVAARPVVTRRFHDEVMQWRRAFSSDFGELRESMLAAADGQDGRDLLHGSWPDHDLEGFPILDTASILPDLALPPPMISAGNLAQRRALELLQRRYEPAIANPLRSYGGRMRDWASRRLQQLEVAFVSIHEASAVVASNENNEQIEASLRELTDRGATTEERSRRT